MKPEVQVLHEPVKTNDYKEYRKRGKQFFKQWAYKNGITGIVDYKGSYAPTGVAPKPKQVKKMTGKKVLLCGWDFETLTGGPMYNYNLARGLKELDCEVVCAGIKAGGAIKEKLNELGCDVYKVEEQGWKGRYDLVVISENMPQFLEGARSENIYNFCHSKHELDKPIDDRRITGYLYPRKQVADHWKIEGQIIPIPIDFNKFSKRLKPRDRYLIACPATIDGLRKPMFLNLINRARNNSKIDVWVIGKDHGGLDGVKYPPNFRILQETATPEKYICQADEVAGIFIGTVTIEAWAAGCKTSVYDEFGNWSYVERPADFDKYNYKNVANEFAKLIV